MLRVFATSLPNFFAARAAMPAWAGKALLGALLAALASLWFCFDSGTVTQTHRVVVTQVFDTQIYLPATSGGARLGGMPARIQRDYRVHCVTALHGVPCRVLPEQYRNYRRGELITADVELAKPANEFGWTFLGTAFAWLAVFFAAMGTIGFKFFSRKVPDVQTDA